MLLFLYNQLSTRRRSNLDSKKKQISGICEYNAKPEIQFYYFASVKFLLIVFKRKMRVDGDIIRSRNVRNIIRVGNLKQLHKRVH
jgi:hypothetical protein